MANVFDQFDQPAPAPQRRTGGIDSDAIARGARELGIDPVDLATAISYETAGTFDPDKRGPTTKWGQHQGLIQFGEPQRAKYGVRPGMSMAEQMPAVVAYLRDAGVQPGMGMLDVYSAINAGRVGRYNASDAAAGGMPGTVADKVNTQMGDHRRKAMLVMGQGGGGGGGSYPAPAAANPFDQFDDAPAAQDLVSGFRTLNAARAPGTAAPAGPNLPPLPAAPAASGNGDIPLRPQDREVGRIYTDKRGIPRRWLGDSWASGDAARETSLAETLGGAGIDLVQGLTRVPESLLDLVGWATGGESLLTPEGKRAFEESRQFYEQFKPEAYRAEQATPIVQTNEAGEITGVNLPSGESVAGTIAQSLPQIPAMLYGGGGLRSVAEKALPNAPRLAAVLGYGGANAAMVAPGAAEQARMEALDSGATPEQAQQAANVAMALTAPLTFATGGLGEGLAAAQGRAAPSLVQAILRGAATETPAEGIEEAGQSAIGDIAQGRKVNAANALEAGLLAATTGATTGGTVGGVEFAAQRNQPAALPADPATLADLLAQAQAPAVAAEVPASPRQDVAPAAPPPPQQVERQEAPAPAQPRPDMTAATRAIDNRLSALDEAAAQQIDEAEVSALNAERQELDDLVREQDRARREGIVQPLEARLSPEERATADARRQEIAATLERHRAARTAADQAQRLRARLESADTDAALYDVAREIDPTLGTPQAEAFRAPTLRGEKINNPPPASESGAQPVPPAPMNPPAPASAAPMQGPSAPIETNAGTTTNVENVADRLTQSGLIVGQRARSERPPAPPAEAPETGIPVSPRAESQREPAPAAAPEAPARTTSVKNAVTDAERVAEGRDPIIREARKANRETVDEAVQALRETPTLGRETANRLASGGPVELKDEAVLLVHKVDLRKRRDAAAERAQSPDLSEEARATARREYDDLVQQIDEVDQAAVRVGTESGRLLQLRRRMIAEDYSLPALERKLRMVVNRDLKPGERAELKEMADKVADLQRKLDAAESKQAGTQVAEMLARLMKGSPGRGATLEQRRTAAAESRAALSAMTQVTSGGQRSVAPAAGKPGQARDALVDRLGRGVVRQLERDGVLKFEGTAGGSWDGVAIRIGDVNPENALGVLLHEASHARLSEVLGAKAYDTALRDLDALEAAGDATAMRAARRAARSGETGARLDNERLAYMAEEAAKANRTTGGVSAKARELVRRILSAFRQWAATSPVFRALERIGAPRPTLQPEDFVAFAQASLRRLMEDAARPESRRLRGRIGALETELRTDNLTGMRNKRAFDEDASLGWPSVVAIDMDGLKRLNDAIGHEAADNVMRALADELRASEGDGARFYRRSGDEFAARFRDPADAERVMADLQTALEDMQVQLDVADADGGVRSYTYQGIGISYGTGPNYEAADTAANRQKAARLEAGLREAPRADGPSRRLREDTPRPGGRRAGDPAAEVAQRSIVDQTQTPAFKRWFGDSKVVDENGDPLVVYHGTQASFEVFDPGMSRSGDRSRIDKAGVYLSPDKNFASNYGSRVLPVFVRIERPLIVPSDDFPGLSSGHLTSEDAAEIEKAGFDGVVSGREIVAFRPEQIKSATANRGTFDPTDPNIMRSIPEGPAAPDGVDPVAFFHLARMGAFHYADGARDMAEWTRRMQADLGAAATQYRDALPAAFEASKAQASRPARGAETVAEAMESIGDKRRPRDVKRVVRAAVNEGMRGEDEVFQAAAQALDMDEADVRALFVQPEAGPKTLSEAQAEINRLRKALRDAQRPDPETRYQNQRARDFERRIAELEQRIADGDFAKRERVERELSKENERLRFELEKAKERFHQRAIEAEFEQRSPLGKIFGETVAGVNFARAIMTSLDLSGVFRQGGFITLGNPTRAAKAVPDMLRAFVSERADFRAREELQNRPNAPLYKKAGLQLTGIGGDALSRVEEAYASRWVDKWSRWAGGGLIRGSGRSYTAFLNRLRADSFDAMVAALARDGSNPTTEEIKAIANYINVATGRGKIGTSENVGEALTAIFFAPRLVASRFQLLAGQPLYGGSNRTRKMIAQEYARFLMGVSVAIALAAMMRDEDDETKPIEMDPRSANFGKVRFGDTFLDPLAGLAQVTTFLARVGTGESRTTTKGELIPLRDQYRLTDVAPGLGDGYELGKVGYGGRDIPDVVTNFLRSKLAPVPGAILNVATGKNMIGEEATPLNQAVNLVTPMSVGNLVDVMEAHGMARGTAINLLGILGMSVQYRKGDAEKAVEAENGIPGKLGFGRPPEVTDGE